MKSAFKTDALGKYAYQDPDEDLDWWFDFNDPIDPWLATGETIVSMQEMLLKRLDGAALSGEQTHDPSFSATRAGMYVKSLLLGVTYVIECSVTTNATPLRKVSRTFRLLCVERGISSDR